MNAYQNDLLESVEYLRAHARVSYARALELLEAHGGDVAACLIELERDGCVNPPSDAPGAAPQADAEAAAQADPDAAPDVRSAVSDAMRRAKHAACSALSTLLRLRVNISQAGAQVTDLSALFVLALAILCPPLLLLAALVLLLLGYRFGMSAVQAQDVMQPLGELVRGTGRSLCTLGRSAVQTVRDLMREAQTARG